MNKIKINSLEKELFYEEKIIIVYYIEYPEIILEEYTKNIAENKIYLEYKLINEFYKNKIIKLKKYIENKFYNKAKKDYIHTKEKNKKFKTYKIFLECNVILNNDELIKLKLITKFFNGEKEERNIINEDIWKLKK